MERKSESRWPIELLCNHRWPEAELRAMSEHVDRKMRGQSPFYRSLRSPVNGDCPQATNFNIAERIVRDFRRTEGKERIYAFPTCEVVRRPFFLKRWFQAIDWDNVSRWTNRGIEYACIGALIACLIYLGIFVFGPFAVRILR